MLDILLCPVETPIERRDRDAFEYKLDRFHQEARVRCFWCSRLLVYEDATVDHVVPKWRGGTSDENNLEIACRGCNEKRGVVSALASRIRSIYQNPRARTMDRRKSLLIRALKERDEYLDLLLEVESLYYRRLSPSDPRRRHCLRELDEVLRASLDKP